VIKESITEGENEIRVKRNETNVFVRLH